MDLAWAWRLGLPETGRRPAPGCLCDVAAARAGDSLTCAAEGQVQRGSIAGPWHLVRQPAPFHVSRERSVCASQSFLAGGVKKGPGNPISVMSAENAAARGPVTHDTPSQQPRPATPPITGERGCAPGPALPGVPVSIWPGLPAPAARHEAAAPGRSPSRPPRRLSPRSPGPATWSPRPTALSR